MYKKILLSATILSSVNIIAQNQLPNIIVMFIDDLGYNDLGHKNPSFSTPNIDQLAVESHNFKNAYVASATSSPSRVGLLTGRHPLKVGVIRHISKENGDPYGTGEFTHLKSDPGKMPNRQYLPLEEVTIAEALKKQGYTTYHVGKWHLGTRDFYPDKQGFDFMYGESDLGQPHNYYPPYFKKSAKIDFKGEYLNDHLTDKAINWINNHDYEHTPLMMYFPHYAVHTPHIGQKEKIKKYTDKGLNLKYATYHAMVESMDESVGRIMNTLKSKGISDNTIFIFASDQGGYFSNAPLRGGKMNGALYEGGCRIPLFIHYSNGSKPRIINERISTLDIFPTIIEMAGGKTSDYPQLDGTSLKETLIKGKEPQDKAIYIYRSYDDQPSCIIEDNFKLIKSRSGKDEMYNLLSDESESINIIDIKKHSKQKSKLKRKLDLFLEKNEMSQVFIKN